MVAGDALALIAEEVSSCLSQVDSGEIQAALSLIEASPRVFVGGAGRSGLAVRAIAMRLMHLGVPAFVVGETVTPSLAAGDVLVVGSGSGRTESLLAVARKAKELGGHIVLITIDRESPLAEVAEVVVRIPAPSPKAQVSSEVGRSVQPMGSLFEQSLWLLGDALILLLMERRRIQSDAMFGRHANLE